MNRTVLTVLAVGAIGTVLAVCAILSIRTILTVCAILSVYTIDAVGSVCTVADDLACGHFVFAERTIIVEVESALDLYTAGWTRI